MEKYTSEGLPKISKAVVDVLFRDLNQRGRERTLDQILLRLVDSIKNENDQFDEFVHRFESDLICLGYDAETMKMGAYLAYELFRRQAESNSLEGK